MQVLFSNGHVRFALFQDLYYLSVCPFLFSRSFSWFWALKRHGRRFRRLRQGPGTSRNGLSLAGRRQTTRGKIDWCILGQTTIGFGYVRFVALRVVVCAACLCAAAFVCRWCRWWVFCLRTGRRWLEKDVFCAFCCCVGLVHFVASASL